MYNKEKIWYNINELNSLLGLSKTIIKKRFKENSNLLILNKTFNSIKSKKGKKMNLYHLSILNNVFGNRNKPLCISITEIRRKYIGTSKWDYIGTILPERSSVIDIQYKMRFFNNQLRIKYGNKIGVRLFYSIEPNPNDKYFHCHFLLSSKTKMNELIFIKEQLTIIGGDKTKDRTPFDLKEYDFKTYGFSGSFYSFKHKSVFDELLNK
jgi:hypothetical protein